MQLMAISALTQAPVTIQVHAFSAIAAFGLGTYLLNARKGVRVHRVLGWVWAGLMVVVAGSSLFINELRHVGPFSAIHLLTLLTLVMLPLALYFARHHRVSGHAKTMRGLYWGALVIAGAFTFMPGRIMHSVVFGG